MLVLLQLIRPYGKGAGSQHNIHVSARSGGFIAGDVIFLDQLIGDLSHGVLIFH